MIDFKSRLKFGPPQGWEDDLSKMNYFRFSRLRDVNQPKVLTERGKFLLLFFSISISLSFICLFSLAENGKHLERLYGKGTYSSVANPDKVTMCNSDENI